MERGNPFDCQPTQRRRQFRPWRDSGMGGVYGFQQQIEHPVNQDVLIGVDVVPVVAAVEGYGVRRRVKCGSEGHRIPGIVFAGIIPATEDAGVALILENDIFPRNHRTGDAASRMWLIGQVAAIQRPESAVTFC